MRLLIYLICVLSFLSVSCQYGVDFKVQNNADKIIDSLIITNGFNSLKFYNVDPEEKKEGFLDFKENPPKHDGLYGIQLFIKDSIQEKHFGYYSNGIPGKSSFDISIFKDSIQINEYLPK